MHGIFATNQSTSPSFLRVSNASTEGVLTSKQLRHTIPRSTPSSPTYLLAYRPHRATFPTGSRFPFRKRERETKQQGPELLPTWDPKHLTSSVSRSPPYSLPIDDRASLSGCWIVQLRAAPLFLCLPLSVSSLFIRLLGLCRSVSRVRATMSRDDKLNSGPGAAAGSSSQEADLAQVRFSPYLPISYLPTYPAFPF